MLQTKYNMTVNAYKKSSAIQYFVKLTMRSFLGIGTFSESDFVKKFVEGYFRQLEWSLVISTILTIGIKFSNIVLAIGVIGVVLMLWHSIIFWYNELIDAWLKSIDKFNEKRFVKDGFLPPYYSSSKYSLATLFIILITFFAFNILLIYLVMTALLSI